MEMTWCQTSDRIEYKQRQNKINNDRYASLELENVYLKAQIEQLIGRLNFVEKNTLNRISGLERMDKNSTIETEDKLQNYQSISNKSDSVGTYDDTYGYTVGRIHASVNCNSRLERYENDDKNQCRVETSRATKGLVDTGTAESQTEVCEVSQSKNQTKEKQRFSSKQELSHWVASKPGCRLARAKYNYRPLRDSPNENPEFELSLQPGDFVLIFGEMDEDFFYRGESIGGQRGLVPSNYIEIIPEEELAVSASRTGQATQTHTSPFAKNVDKTKSFAEFPQRTGGQDTNAVSIYKGASTSSADISSRVAYSQPFALPDITCPYPLVDVTNVTVLEVRQQDDVIGCAS